MDNHETNQLQVLANDLYVIHEKIIKTDALIKIVKEKSKRCNKLEKLHKKLLDTHTQMQMKHSESELKLNNCIVNHTPLEIELKELRARFANAEALHSDYVNAAELKYQNVCQELENLKNSPIDCSSKTKERRNKKTSRNMTKEELMSKLDDLTIEFELTKSELESVSQEIKEKDKIINKYEYEKQSLNEKIKLLNNKVNRNEAAKYVNKITIGVQTDNINVNEDPLVENDFVMDVLPSLSELDNTLPILSDSICAEIVKSVEKEFTSSCVQTDDLCLFVKKVQNFKSCAVQTDFVTKKSFSSFGCQTNIATNCVQLQTDDDLWVKHYENLRREKLKTSSSQTYYDDILNLEDILLEMTACQPLVSPLSPNSVDESTREEEEDPIKSNTIAVGSDEIIPTFVDFYCQTDRNEKVDSFAQTENLSNSIETKNMKTNKSIITSHKNPVMIDSNSQTDKIQSIESNTQTESQRKVDNTCQTDHYTITTPNPKSFPNNLLSPITKMSQRFCETKLKNKLYTPNSKISKKYKTTKNKLLENLKLSNLDFKQILEKYLSEGNGPTLFVSPKILKSSQLNNVYNPCNKHQNPFINISNRSILKSKSFNLHECPCYHSCNIQRNYPSCTTLQCNISCNGCPGYPGYPGYCNHSHRIKIKHNSKAVIVSSDSEEEEYNIRNYYKNKFRNKYRTKRNCKCNEFPNEHFYNKLNSLKREAKSSDTDTSVNNCKKKKRRRRVIISSESDDSDSENVSSQRDKHKRHKFKNPISQIAQEKIINTNSSATSETRIINDKNTKLDFNQRVSEKDTSYRDKLKNPVSKNSETNPPTLLTQKPVSKNSETNPPTLLTQKGNKSIQTKNTIEDEEMPITNENINIIDSNCDNLLNNNINIQNKDENTKNISSEKKVAEKCKNIAKPTKEKSTKIKRLRNLLNKTPLNYNKSNIRTRSMSKNIQEESNNTPNIPPKSAEREMDLFGSLSESSTNSDNEVLSKIAKNSKLAKSNNKNTIETRNKCKNVAVTSKKQINNNIKPPPLNITPEKIQIKKCVSPLKKSRNLENFDTPANHVYKRPERRQIIPIGPLSPEPVTCEIIQPKVIPLEQVSKTLNFNALGENSTNVNLDCSIASEEISQKQSKIIAEVIPTSVINHKPVKEANLLPDINAASCSSKQSKVQLQEKRFAIKMISDIATMDWDMNLLNTVVASLVNQDALMIAKLIVSEAAIDHAEQLDKSFTPPAPLMMPCQQKLLVLISRLDNEGLKGLKKKVIILTEKRILSEKNLINISGLTRIYVALCKLEYDIEGVRLFCCNAAYYLGDLFLPVMFIVLTMWGDVLPMASADVPLAVTLVQIIQSKTCSTPGYNTSTLNRLLSDYYEYKRGEITNDQVMDKLVTCFIENPCSSIFTSILILCKNLPSKWRFSQIKKHFIPLVDTHRVDQSKSKLISMTLTLVNRIKDMFNSGNDKEYINELNVWLVKLISNNCNTSNC